MSIKGTLREWDVDIHALQHFTSVPPDDPNGALYVDGEPYGSGGGGGSYTHPNHSGDVTSVADGAQTIAASAVTNAKMANMVAATIKGRNGSTGAPEGLTPTEVRTMLNVADGANAYVHPNHSGDVTSVADGAQTIAADAVTNSKAANMAESTIKGRAASAGTGDPTDLTAAQVRTLINVADGANAGITALTGAVTASGVGSVAATIASDAVTTVKVLDANITNAKLANMTTKTLKGRNTGSTGVPEDVTALQLRSFIKRTSTETSNTAPSIDSDAVDAHYITALTGNITGITVTGTPFNGQLLWLGITGTATRTITDGNSILEASTVAIPTTTSGTALLDILLRWNSATSKWRVVAVA